MEINFSEDVQKALDLMDESDRPEYIQNVVRMQLVRDGRLAGIAWSTGGGSGVYSYGGGLKGEVPIDNPSDYIPSPIAEKTNMTGVVPEMAKGIVSVATQQEVDHFYDRNNEPARSIYPSHLNRPS